MAHYTGQFAARRGYVFSSIASLLVAIPRHQNDLYLSGFHESAVLYPSDQQLMSNKFVSNDWNYGIGTNILSGLYTAGQFQNFRFSIYHVGVAP